MARYLRREDTSRIACASCLQKSQILRKKQTFFWRQLSLQKVKFVKFGVKKEIWQPWWAEAACTLFFICWPVSDDNDSSSPEVKIPPCQHTWFWMAWLVEFFCADRLGPEKLLIWLHWFGTLPWLGSNHLCELCTWFTAHWHCSVAKLWDRTCELL